MEITTYLPTVMWSKIGSSLLNFLNAFDNFSDTFAFRFFNDLWKEQQKITSWTITTLLTKFKSNWNSPLCTTSFLCTTPKIAACSAGSNDLADVFPVLHPVRNLVFKQQDKWKVNSQQYLAIYLSIESNNHRCSTNGVEYQVNIKNRFDGPNKQYFFLVFFSMPLSLNFWSE